MKTKISNLTERNGWYYFRSRISGHSRKKEIRVSLRTTDLQNAIIKCKYIIFCVLHKTQRVKRTVNVPIHPLLWEQLNKALEWKNAEYVMSTLAQRCLSPSSPISAEAVTVFKLNFDFSFTVIPSLNLRGGHVACFFKLSTKIVTIIKTLMTIIRTAKLRSSVLLLSYLSVLNFLTLKFYYDFLIISSLLHFFLS